MIRNASEIACMYSLAVDIFDTSNQQTKEGVNKIGKFSAVNNCIMLYGERS